MGNRGLRDDKPMRAAQYLRMSTEHQKYSLENQSAANHAYAAIGGMEIVRTYSDGGKSGLTFDGREGIQRLIADVGSGSADFSAILVYDVSRWGRSQDADESGYYEYLCKRAGVKVHYCAEQFENDGSSFAAVVKAIKRAMAGEYSRELSVKVFWGQSRLARAGYRLGASAPYGLRRMLVDGNGRPKCYLAFGELKSIQTDRVVLVHGSSTEIEIIRWIFRTFVRQKKSTGQIAELLNRRGVRRVRRAPWASHHVRHILTNENYIGNAVWNRQSCKLKTRAINNSQEKWIRVEGVCQEIVSKSLFDAAQSVIRQQREGLSREQKLEPLRRLLRKHGTLSARLIDHSAETPCCASYARWFGGLLPAYELIGFTQRSRCLNGRSRRTQHGITRELSNDRLLEMLSNLYQEHGYLTREIINQAEGVPSCGTYRLRFGSLERAYELMGLPWIYPNHRPRRPHRSSVSLSDDQLLDALRTLRSRRGYLSQKLIEETPRVPSATTYKNRFGSLIRAYELIGYGGAARASRSRADRTKSLSKKQMLNLLRALLREQRKLSWNLINRNQSLPSIPTYLWRFGSLARIYKMIGYKDGERRCRSTDLEET
jgi:DNA invertase Pin-like site-specific DNA recombinase